MKKLFIFVVLFLCMHSLALGATEINEDIAEDTIWTKDGSPYILRSHINVNQGATLTLQPGVIVKFNNLRPEGLYFNVFGSIVSLGTEKEKVYFTELRDDTLGGDSNVDGGATLPKMPVDPFPGWVIYFYNSHFSKFDNVEVRYASLVGFLDSNIDVKNLEIQDSNGGFFAGGGKMSLRNFKANNIYYTPLEISGGNLDASDININNVLHGDAVFVSSGHLVLNDAAISNVGISSEQSEIIFDSNGITLDGGWALISSTTIRNGKGSAVKLIDQGVFNSVPFLPTQIKYSVLDNFKRGINNLSTTTIDARNVFWGDMSGPYNSVLNPEGKGLSASDYVDFKPWLTRDPFQNSLCCSNVIFLPGLMASRLYKDSNQLWEPNRNADVEKLFLDEDGNSLDPTIYTKDIILETNLPLLHLNIYKSFAHLMDEMKLSGQINEWQPLPYDWRLNLEKIYPELNKRIEALAKNSQTGKVTIVAHSNGGLLAKMFLQKNNTSNFVDRVVLIGSPQIGTPESIAGLLYGENQEIAGGLVLNSAVAQKLAQNMPGAYGLLPSAEFFKGGDLITFDKSLNKNNINSKESFNDFLLTEGVSEKLLQNSDYLHNKIDNYIFPESIPLIQIAGHGLDTVKGIEYKTTHGKLDHEPVLTKSGDGTVLSTSALSEVGSETYYMNLPVYNRGLKINRDHSTILEVRNVLDLVKNIISGTSTLPALISKEAPSVTSGIRASVHSPVSLEIKDSEGRLTREGEEQIPNSYYFVMGEGKYIGVDGEDSYVIKLQGLDYGTFNFSIEKLNGEDVIASSSYMEIPVTPLTKAWITTDSEEGSSPLSMDLDGNGSVDFEINQTENIDPLIYLEFIRQFVNSMDLKQATKNEIFMKIDKIVTSIKKGKIGKSQEEIEQFIKKIGLESGYLKLLTTSDKNMFIKSLEELLNTLK
jgi:pimeloyl-ACP methyl ester carboxylesterase